MSVRGSASAPLASTTPSLASSSNAPLTLLSPIDAMFASIARRPPEPSVVLIGLHVEKPETYGPLYDEGAPEVDTRPGYRTLAIEVKPGGAVLARDLPYLTVPAGDRFVLVSEATVSIPDKRPLAAREADENPHWFSATGLVMAKDPAALKKAVHTSEARLKAQKQWGITRATSVLYASPRALCVLDSEAEWTGGALAFSGSMHQHTVPVAGSFDPLLLAHADEKQVIGFAREVMKDHFDPDDEVSLDEDLDVGWERKVKLRTDAMACLARENGRPMLTGAVTLSGNSARSFAADAPIAEAPAEFGIHRGGVVDLAKVKAAIPTASDAMLSPAGDALIVVEEKQVEVFDVDSHRSVLQIPVEGALLTMEEWATKEQALAWLDALPR